MMEYTGTKKQTVKIRRELTKFKNFAVWYDGDEAVYIFFNDGHRAVLKNAIRIGYTSKVCDALPLFDLGVALCLLEHDKKELNREIKRKEGYI